MLSINSPLPMFYELDGVPLNGGHAYFGTAGANPEVSPIPVYWDAAGTIPASQPISVSNGFLVNGATPSHLFVGSDFAITVRNAAGSLILYSPNSYDVAVVFGGTNGSDSLGFTPAGTGAVARNVGDKLRESVSVTDFGAVAGDNTKGAANLAAFLAAINSFPEQSTAALDPAYSNAGQIFIPPGTYWINGPLEIKRNVRLYGPTSPDGNSFGAVRLVFPDNTHGIIIHNYVTSGTGLGADGAIIESMSVIPTAYQATGATPAPGNYHGIWVRGRAKMNYLQVSGWSGNNVQIVASVGGGGLLEGNANNWSVTDLVAQQAGRTNFYVSGADVNAGKGERIDSRSNRGSGIWDASFLGNTYIACHAATAGINAQVTYLSGRYYVLSDTLGASTTPGSNDAIWVPISRGRVSFGGNRYSCLNATLGPSTTPGTNPAVWSLIGAGGVSAPEFTLWVSGGIYNVDEAHSAYPPWSGSGTYLQGSPYRVDNANGRTVLVGCYSEGGQPPSDLTGEASAPGASSSALVVGGIHAADFTARTTAAYMDNGIGNLSIKHATIKPWMGVDFASTVASNVASCLDRYLEGTWTPTVVSATLAAGAPSAATAAGYYTVIGNEVHWQITYTPSNTTTIAFTTNTTTFTLPPYTPAVAGAGAGASLAGVVTLIGLTKTDGLFYPRTIAATNDTIVMTGSYRIAT